MQARDYGGLDKGVNIEGSKNWSDLIYFFISDLTYFWW
jgi:hypothetical protein